VAQRKKEAEAKKILIYSFLNKHVSVKVKEGYAIEGTLVHVDSSQKHNGIGNLILANGTIIRASHVLHIAIKD